MKKIIVWGWGRDATITAVRKVIERGIAEPVLWISPADESFYGPKEFAYIPSCVLESLVTEQGGERPVYAGDEATLNADLVRFMDMYSRVNISSAMSFHEMQNLFHLYYTYFAGLILRHGVKHVVFFGAPHVGADYVLYRAAKLLGVSTSCTFPGRVPNRIFSVGDVKDYGKFDTAPMHLAKPVQSTSPRRSIFLKRNERSYNISLNILRYRF